MPFLRPTLRTIAVAIATGAMLSSVAFDAISQKAEQQFIYAQGAYVLLAIGLLTGLAASLLRVADLGELPRGTPERQDMLRLLGLLDALLLVGAGLFLYRRSRGSNVALPWALVPVDGAFAIAVVAVLVLQIAPLPRWALPEAGAAPSAGAGSEQVRSPTARAGHEVSP